MHTLSISADGCSHEVVFRWTKQYDHVSDAIELYRDAGLRRPVDDLGRMRQLLAGANSYSLATIDDKLVGLARGLSDGAHVCYLADMAVLRRFQRSGIGRTLIEVFVQGVGDGVTVVVHAATGAAGFYSRIGFEKWDDVFRWPRRR